MVIEIGEKYQSLLKDALDDYQYKLAIELNALKGHALTQRRKDLTQKQRLLEELLALLNS